MGSKAVAGGTVVIKLHCLCGETTMQRTVWVRMGADLVPELLNLACPMCVQPVARSGNKIRVVYKCGSSPGA